MLKNLVFPHGDESYNYKCHAQFLHYECVALDNLKGSLQIFFNLNEFSISMSGGSKEIQFHASMILCASGSRLSGEFLGLRRGGQ